MPVDDTKICNEPGHEQKCDEYGTPADASTDQTTEEKKMKRADDDEGNDEDAVDKLDPTVDDGESRYLGFSSSFSRQSASMFLIALL